MKFCRGIYYFKYSTFASLIFKVASVFSRQFIYKILNYDFVYFGLLFAILRFRHFAILRILRYRVSVYFVFCDFDASKVPLCP